MNFSEKFAEVTAKAKIEAEKALEAAKKNAQPFIDAGNEAANNAGPVAEELLAGAKKKLQQLKGAMAGEETAVPAEVMPEVTTVPTSEKIYKTAKERTLAKRAEYAAAAEAAAPEVKKTAVKKRTTRTPKK